MLTFNCFKWTICKIKSCQQYIIMMCVVLVLENMKIDPLYFEVEGTSKFLTLTWINDQYKLQKCAKNSRNFTKL